MRGHPRKKSELNDLNHCFSRKKQEKAKGGNISILKVVPSLSLLPLMIDLKLLTINRRLDLGKNQFLYMFHAQRL